MGVAVPPKGGGVHPQQTKSDEMGHFKNRPNQGKWDISTYTAFILYRSVAAVSRECFEHLKNLLTHTRCVRLWLRRGDRGSRML